MVKESNCVYLLYGEEEFQKEEFIKQFINTLFPDKKTLTFNLNTYDAGDIDIEDAIDSANTLPFLSQYRIVIINNVELLKENQINLLLRYCKNPNLNTRLILLTNKSKLPPGFSDLAGRSKRFNSLSSEELFLWIKNRLKAHGRMVESDAVELIAESCGNNLAIISKELEKLITYTGKRTQIKRQDAEDVLGRGINKTAFEYLDLIFEEDISGALEALNSIKVEIQRHPPKLLGLILWNFKQILKIKTLMNEGKKEYEIFQMLRLNRSRASGFIRHAKKFNMQKLKTVFKTLLELDLSLKRSRILPHAGYELLSARLFAPLEIEKGKVIS